MADDLRSPANPRGGYNVRALREEIVRARAQGATDEELFAELQDVPGLGEKLRSMAALGPTKALDNAAVIQAPDVYDPTEGMGFKEKVTAGLAMGVDKAARGAKQFFGSPFVDQPTRDRWASENAEADRLNAPLRDTVGGAVGEAWGDVGTTMLPGIGATVGALKMIPKAGGLIARAGRALTGAAAGGAGVQTVTPETTSLNTKSDYGAKLARGAVEGVAGDMAARGAGRLIKPLRFDIDPEHAARLERLRRVGIGNDTPVNGQQGGFDLAQLTNDQTVHDLRSSLSKLPGFSSRAQGVKDAQLGDFTQSVMARTGTPSRNVSQTSLREARSALGARREAFNKMGPVPMDSQYLAELLQAKRELGPSLTLAGADARTLNPITNAQQMFRGGRGSLPADKALDIRGDLSEQAHSLYNNGGGLEAKAVHAGQEAMDNAIRRGFDAQSPGAGDAWDAYRRNMRAYMDVSDAAGRPGGATPGDFLNPKSLASTMRASEGRGRFASGQAGELATISDDASRVLTDPVPNSGTPQRSLYSMLLLGGPAALVRSASGQGNPITGAVKNVASLGLGPTIAHHMIYGKGVLGKNHLAHGALGEASGDVIDKLIKTNPAFAAALIERMRMQDEGEQQ